MNISKTPLLQQSTLRKTAKALTCGCILWTAASFLKQNDTYYNPISYEKQTYLHTDCEDSFHKLCETVDKQNGGIGCEVVKYWHRNDKSASEKFFHNTKVFLTKSVDSCFRNIVDPATSNGPILPEILTIFGLSFCSALKNKTIKHKTIPKLLNNKINAKSLW